MLTGLAFLPFAVALAAGVHAGSHGLNRAGVRVPMASGFAAAAGGTLLLSTSLVCSSPASGSASSSCASPSPS